jgi:hypothetical protein
MVSSRTYKRQCRPRPIQRATRAQLRGGVTHVAFVADRPEVQAVLPQVIIHNKHMPTLRTRRAIAAEVPDNGVIVRQTSSWTNTDNMVDLLRRLGLALTPWTRALQPILFLDCAKQHLHPRVVAAANRAGVWLVYIPASMTWLLQPCDTHVLAQHKAYLDRAYTEAQAESSTLEVSDEDWLRIVLRTVRVVLGGRHWGHAFHENGFVHHADVRQEVRAELGPAPLPPVSFGKPSIEQLQELFPRRYKVPFEQLWRLVDARAAPKAAGARLRIAGPPPAAAPPEAPPAPVEEDIRGAGVWAGRLRPVRARLAGSSSARRAREVSPEGAAGPKRQHGSLLQQCPAHLESPGRAVLCDAGAVDR